MNVLVADKLSATAVQELEDMGATVTFRPDLKADDLPASLAGVEVLVVRSTKVTRQAIQAGEALSLIIRAGAGVNTIDLDAASERGIYVSNCPGKNTAAVAELAIGLMIGADRRIADATQDLREGKWRKKEYGKARGLKGRSLGILGFGAIGRAVAERARGLDMDVVAWSRSLTPEIAELAGIGYAATPKEIAAQSDVVSVHMAMKPETKHMLDREFFDAMKAGAIFVNTSRGEIVDTDALSWAVQERAILAAVDVFENEPSSGEDVFDQTDLAKQITATPHIGASTDQAAEAIAAEVVAIVREFNQTGRPRNEVNIQQKSPAQHSMVVRHYNRVGVLAGVLDELRSAGVNIEEMENVIFDGGRAATCSLKLDSKPEENVVERIRKSENVIRARIT
ncbi:MAG: hydroxyacid dehydrogenase [Spirochaetes bacterium]|jgi:D-3-phosphoglycerate dehydrogenase|nr:hydroxyacid dehydrogenase [Spirochaetota bacterium]